MDSKQNLCYLKSDGALPRSFHQHHPNPQDDIISGTFIRYIFVRTPAFQLTGPDFFPQASPRFVLLSFLTRERRPEVARDEDTDNL